MRLERLPGLRQAPGRLARARPGMVLFESWRGQYADNPRAIAEALHAQRPEITQVWATDAATRAALPDWAEPVLTGGAAYLRALGRCGHVVANTHLPDYFRKRPATTYVQTWHGTPLKRIGLDIPRPDRLEGGSYIAQMRRDVAKWDVLLSPNPFSTEIFREAFGYTGEILETGYPRNDLLASPAAAGIREEVRAGLGLPPGARAVLYAPTWRDGDGFEFVLDERLVAERLSTDTTLLVRAHPNLTVELGSAGGSARIVDVSSHPDIRELYLAADVLVTDYSSVMFDFAVTRKPMLFFTYDLAAYRDRLRGFYFDFELDAPGPLLPTTAALLDALADVDAAVAPYARAYDAFVARFCPHDDGRAADRVIRSVFAS